MGMYVRARDVLHSINGLFHEKHEYEYVCTQGLFMFNTARG